MMCMSLRKLEIIPGFHFYIVEINSKQHSSFLSRLKVELMLLLAILNRLKSFGWYFLMFANNQIYWKVELTQNVYMKCNNRMILAIYKKFPFHYLLLSRYIIFQPNHFPQM